MRNILSICTLLGSALLASASARSSQQNYSRPENQAAFGAVKAMAYYALHPEEITTQNLRKSFPGEYEKMELTCHGDVGYCGFGNVDAAQDPQLQSYYVAAGNENQRIGGTLALSFGKSKYCYRRVDLDAVFDKTGVEPSAPPPIGFGNGPPPKTYRYSLINLQHPKIYATALVSEGCVVNINLDARLLN